MNQTHKMVLRPRQRVATRSNASGGGGDWPELIVI